MDQTSHLQKKMLDLKKIIVVNNYIKCQLQQQIIT